MSENNCRNCKYFDGFDGVGELWTDCSLLGGFKDSRTNCEHFEKKVTRYDLLNRINELEKENEQLRKELFIVETDCKNVKESRNHYRTENEQLKGIFYDIISQYDETHTSDNSLYSIKVFVDANIYRRITEILRRR